MEVPLDFSALLGLADKTHSSNKQSNSKFISLQVQSNKKAPKDKKLSEGVRRFKEKQAEEERRKRTQEKQKMNNLLEMRRGDKKSTRAANSMLQRTKSANRSVLAEASSSRDTAHTLAGRNQCDEDDYGYESAAGMAMYERLMSRYESGPQEDPMDKFTRSGAPKKKKDLAATVARVKGALDSGADEDEKPMTFAKAEKKARLEEEARRREEERERERRQREEDAKKSSKEKREEEARRKRLKLAKKAPPPMSFEELTKMAQKKHKEPVRLEKALNKQPIRESEFDRPMTKKEKEEYLREKESERRKFAKGSNKGPSSSSEAKGKQKQTDKQSSGTFKKPLGVPGPSRSSDKNIRDADKSGEKERPSFKTEAHKKEEPLPPPKPKPRPIIGPEFHPAVVKSKKESSRDPDRRSGSGSSSSQSRPKSSSSSHNSSSTSRRKHEEEEEEDEDEEEDYPRRRGKKRPRSRTPSPVRGGGNRNSSRVIDSEEEEEEDDEEMDDFIDDSDATVDISAQIRNIFGYDRRRYRDERDFDDRSMECNRFSEVMKEEARSARIGMQEDLEDMRREEEEKKRKRAKAKNKRR